MARILVTFAVIVASFLVLLLYLDVTSESFRRNALAILNPEAADNLPSRVQNHMVDEYNLFESGILMKNTQPFEDEAKEAKFKALGYRTLYLLNHEKETVEKRGLPYMNMKEYPAQREMLVFVINGNQGSFEQFPIIMNTIENYTNYLTDVQNFTNLDALNLGIEGLKGSPGHRTHFQVHPFGFDMAFQPQAFSRAMFEDQIEFMEHNILAIMKQSFYRNMKINIIGHSIGCLHALKMEETFREAGHTLQNMICLGTPLEDEPLQNLNKDLRDIIQEIQTQKRESEAENRKTKYFFFDSGTKDFHIANHKAMTMKAAQERYGTYFNPMNTLFVDIEKDMKHVYSSLNHASLFYSKYFMDSFSVFAAKMMLISKDAQALDIAKQHLFLDLRQVKMKGWHERGLTDPADVRPCLGAPRIALGQEIELDTKGLNETWSLVEIESRSEFFKVAFTLNLTYQGIHGKDRAPQVQMYGIDPEPDTCSDDHGDDMPYCREQVHLLNYGREIRYHSLVPFYKGDPRFEAEKQASKFVLNFDLVEMNPTEICVHLKFFREKQSSKKFKKPTPGEPIPFHHHQDLVRQKHDRLQYLGSDSLYHVEDHMANTPSSGKVIMRLSEGVPTETTMREDNLLEVALPEKTKFYENPLRFKYIVTTGFRRDGVGIIRIGLLLGLAYSWLASEKTALDLPALFIGYLVTQAKIDELEMLKQLFADISQTPTAYQAIGVIAPLAIAILFKLVNDILRAGPLKVLTADKHARMISGLRMTMTALIVVLCSINIYLGAQSYKRASEEIPDMGGEKYFLLDALAFIVVAINLKLGPRSPSRIGSIYTALILFTLIWNLDTILTTEAWKIKKQVWSAQFDRRLPGVSLGDSLSSIASLGEASIRNEHSLVFWDRILVSGVILLLDLI